MSNIILKNKGIKTTVQREMVFNIVKDSKIPITIKDIYDKCKSMKKIDLSTIYRILELYIEKNIFQKNPDSKGIIYYEYKTSSHKHFIECIKCNEKTIINYCPIKEISHKVLENTGYIISEHNIQLRGTCKKCSKRY